MTVRLAARVGSGAWNLQIARRGGGYAVIIEGDDRIVEVGGADALRTVSIDGRIYEACVARNGRPTDGGQEAAYDVTIGGRLYAVSIADPLRARSGRTAAEGGGGPAEIRSVMPGKVVQVLVAPGQQVAIGEGLVVVEAMKMENEITAPRAGTVTAVAARQGEAVEAGALLVTLD